MYTLSLKLETELYQEDILNKRFEIARKMYNSLLAKVLKRYNKLIKTKEWIDNQLNIKNNFNNKKNCKEFYSIKNKLLKEYNLNEYSLHKDIKTMQHKFKKNIDSFTAQKLASRLWIAFEDLFYGNGEKVHFKSYNQGLFSLEGKSNKTGIRYNLKNNTLEWNKLIIPVKLNKKNNYEIDSLKNEIKYCRIKRIFVKNKYKFVLQLILDGEPPLKYNEDTGEIKHCLGEGKIGIDIGTQTIAYSSDKEVKLLELAPNVKNIEKEKRRLLRKLDRSRRETNKNNYNENGTIKKGIFINGKKEKLKWYKSNKYLKISNELKNIYRKQADIRRLDHNIMANEIIKLGNIVLVEDMNYKALQKRAKKTEKNEKGKFKKKKRFGKSLANKAPSMFLTILDNKLKFLGGELIEVNTYKVKASQYNHLNDEYNKKKLSQRWNYFEYEGKELKIQRDLYSSYLIKNVNEDKESINKELCNEGFKNFIMLHNKEIEKLSGLKNINSMGI